MNAILKKTHFLILTGFLVGCAAKEAAMPAAPAPEAAPAVQPVEVRLGKLIAVDQRTFNLKNPADTERYEKAVAQMFNHIWARHVPGLQILVCKGDRGVNTGRYVQLWNFDTQERRDYYAPVADADEAPAHTTAAVEPLDAELEEKWGFESSDFIFSDSLRNYTDYVLVGSDQVAEMPLVGLLGIHHLKVNAGMEEAFEAFITTKYYPAMKDLLPGLWFFYYKGDRGADIGGYIHVYAFDSPERRDAYVPEPGQASEVVQEAFTAVQDLFDEQDTYFVQADTATGEPVAEYTDWVIIR